MRPTIFICALALATLLLTLGMRGNDSSAGASPTSDCRFAEDEMEILPTAYDGYLELAHSEKRHPNGWILFTWYSNGQEYDIAYQWLATEDNDNAFGNAIEWLAKNSTQIQAYALVWQDTILDMESLQGEPVIRVNAGYKNGKAYEVFIQEVGDKISGVELGCAVNLLGVGISRKEK